MVLKWIDNQNALALEYQRDYGSARGNLDILNLVNNPCANGVCSVFGLTDSFLSSKSMAHYVGPELAEKLSQPLKFQWVSAGLEQPPQPPSTVNGFDVTMCGQTQSI